jgi:hypothetical protein
MKPDQLLHRIADRTNQLVPAIPIIRQRVNEWTRGGHKKVSIGEGGSRGNEHPIPISQKVRDRNDDGTPTRWGQVGPADNVDRDIRRHERGFLRALEDADVALTRAAQHAAWFTEIAEPIDDPPEIPCGNLRCTDPLDPGRTTGECSKCRKHRSRHGTAWPTMP